MNLYSPIISGSLTVSGSTILTGDVIISGSFVVSSSIPTSASYASNADKLDGLDSTVFTLTSSFNDLTASVNSLTSRTASFATTGSNTFVATQRVTDTTVATGFANSSASIYTDGGLLVAKDSYFSSSMYIKGDLTVYGTQSIAYISSSQLNIGTNIITVNTATPVVRFGGLSVYDSGSTQLTGSILWDSQNNRWVYSNPSGSTYDGGMLISGPRNTSGLGNEQGTTACMLLVGQGGDHLTSSMIYHSSTVTCFGNRICSPSLTTANLRISDESTYGLSICKGSGGYPILQADLGQSIGFYNGEGAGTSAERLKIWQTGIITIGCQVCVPQITVSNAGGTSYNIANFINTNSTTNSQTYFFMGGNLSNGRAGFMDWIDNTDCANGYVAFGVYGDNPATGTGNGLMIKRGACVGINNNNPLRYLHIGPGTDSPVNPNNGLYITENGTTAIILRDSTNNVEYTEQVGSTGAIVGTLTNHDLITYVNNAEVSRIQNGGNVFYAGTGGVSIQKGTTAQRPASCTGMMRYNTTFNLMEFYNGTSWVQIGSGDLSTGQCINNTSMCHNVYIVPGGYLGLQGQGSVCISAYGAAALSINSGFNSASYAFSTHGGHCGIVDYPGYWAVHLGGARAINNLRIYMHANSWGYFELAGSNNSGNGSNFSQCGTWTNLSFVCSTNGYQNMGGNSSGCADGTILNFWYANDVPFAAYRIKVLDSSRPGMSQGSIYGGSAGYVWELNRV